LERLKILEKTKVKPPYFTAHWEKSFTHKPPWKCIHNIIIAYRQIAVLILLWKKKLKN